MADGDWRSPPAALIDLSAEKGEGDLRLGRRWTMIARMMGKMLERGRVTIPIELRRKYSMKPGIRLIVRDEGDKIAIITLPQYVHSLRGKYQGSGMMERLREERQSGEILDNRIELHRIE